MINRNESEWGGDLGIKSRNPVIPAKPGFWATGFLGYRPNAFARVLNDRGEIVNIVNPRASVGKS
ncbi:MAG: hypothetical protein EBE86_010100 [Hormoscilla sp. GUM202]|nr:hypothetical protein [Hormoscilla sp. GUM202]